MSSGESITHWIAKLQLGETSEAQYAIWNRYAARLGQLAKRHMRAVRRGPADEEDVVACALNSFFARVPKGQFPRLQDRSDLWPLLAKITARKAINQRQRELAQKRGGGRVRGESVFMHADEASALGLEEHIVDDLTPEYLLLMNDECQELLDLLPEQILREIAQLKLRGFTNAEIARTLEVTERTVERKLNRIRHCWNHRLE